ncbi:TetR/AcrR family transcriptional regulator [Nocardia sp. NPDC052278]|uniref:TetR/AcrR family transcriptional regulator n=1 Tax=unclassified Nocardia TaxID=2637762 RepID=UPI0036C84EB0
MAENRSRRELLQDTAIQVLAAKGSRGLTHRQVDQDAGAPEGTTKNYFPTRDALLVATAERHFQTYVEDVTALRSATAPSDREGFIALLAQIMRRVPGPGRPGADVFVEMHAEALRNPTVRRLLADMIATDFSVNEALQRAAGLPVTAATARVLTRCLHTATMELLTTPPDALRRIGLDDLDAFTRELVDVIYPEPPASGSGSRSSAH